MSNAKGRFRLLTVHFGDSAPAPRVVRRFDDGNGTSSALGISVDQLDALGLVVNAIALWNTRYIDAALAHLRELGGQVLPADVRRLSPMGFAHINLFGRYYFGLSEAVRRGGLRPLRKPVSPPFAMGTKITGITGARSPQC